MFLEQQWLSQFLPETNQGFTYAGWDDGNVWDGWNFGISVRNDGNAGTWGMEILGPNRNGMMRIGGVNNYFIHGTKKGKVEDKYGNTEDKHCA